MKIMESVTKSEIRRRKLLGNKIKEALDGRKQYWLAEKLGIPDDYLSNKLNGRKQLTQEELDKINVILDTSFTL